jgi:hypothetical protein
VVGPTGAEPGMRPDGWEMRLALAVDAARDKAFVWGVHDCATWAFDVRAAVTGTPRPAWSYATEAGGLRWMARQGWKSFDAAATAILGDPVPVLMAHRGDIVLRENAFGVCLGAQAAFVAPIGLTFIPLRDCGMAWRV